MTSTADHPSHQPHPAVFLFLRAPDGMVSGYVTVTLAYALAQANIGIDAIATIVALNLLPNTWKVLWSPIVDTTLTRKRWFMISVAATIIALFAIGLVPQTAAGLSLLYLLVFIVSLAAGISSIASSALMAHAVPDARRGAAAGWTQAGNLGGMGLGGGLGLWLAQHSASAFWPAAALALACTLCCAALAFIAEPPPDPAVPPLSVGLLASLRGVGRDVWALLRSRRGVLAIGIVFLPIGTGAAGGLFAAIAGDWRASADLVALTTGGLSGVLAIAGSLVSGYLCDMMDRKLAYALCGITQALIAVAMALAPHNAAMFTLFVCLYNFANGLAYAGFAAVVLEAIGTGAAATKFSLLVCLSNIPILYMTKLEGAVQAGHGSTALLLAEAGIAVAAILVFAIFAAATARRRGLAAPRQATHGQGGT